MALAGAGCRVRWIVPMSSAAPRALAGVNVVTVRARAPGFKAVSARLLDGLTEASLAREIRRDLPTLVHFLDYGGSVSVNAPWVANRLGAPVVISAAAPATLCHRGTLVHGDGSECADWSDPRRCADCCLLPSPDGLSTASSWLGRFFQGVRWPLHAYPGSHAFENRLELVAGGLQLADAIVVSSESDRDRLGSLGVRAEQLQLLVAPAVDDWRELYAGVARA